MNARDANVPPSRAALAKIRAIAIGASAGGVHALTALLPVLTAPVAVFVVVHLPRERPSLLADIFRARCALRVCEAEDKEPVQPGTIYFAPPDYHLLIDEGPALSLSVDEPVQHSRPSVDVLFETAADRYRESLMGIILTGANQDGTAGLRAVQMHGGVAIVQRPDTAQAALMPGSASAACPQAHLLTLEAIAQLLRDLDGRELETCT
jgi:two-component system, chemotaxis family, protein-glutamate methylesterase/glutaminase